MSRRVYSWDQNPLVDHHPFRCSNSSASYAVRTGVALVVIDGDGREAIQLVKPRPIEQHLQRTANAGPAVSAKAILLFIKTHCNGDLLHYEIPMAGDRTVFARHRRRRFYPSHRTPPEITASWRPIPA